MDEGQSVGGIALTSRAFGALSFDEEKHAFLARAHQVLAAKCRANTLLLNAGSRTDAAYQAADRNYRTLWEDVNQNMSETASYELLADRGSMLVLVQACPQKFHRCSLALRSDPSFALDVLKNARVFFLLKRHLSESVLEDHKVNLQAVSQMGSNLQFVHDRFKDDKEIVLRAVSSDPHALLWASGRLKADKEVVSLALEREDPAEALRCSILRHASAELREDREIVVAAIAKKAWAFREASACLKADRNVALAALKRQNEDDVMFLHSKNNLFPQVPEVLRADKELVLEAVRVGGDVLQHASLELRQDKDFVLSAMRSAPANAEDQRHCFLQADETLRRLVPFEDFQAAAGTLLATRGDAAPVLTVTLALEQMRLGSSTETSRSIASCEVKLLSGASFTCSLLAPSPPAPSPGTSTTGSISSSGETAETHQPAWKRARVAPSSEPSAQAEASNQIAAAQTVADLAEILVAELPQRLEAPARPNRIFLIFMKSIEEGIESIPVTPWDGQQPLSDFV